jgi:hypothetical protein
VPAEITWEALRDIPGILRPVPAGKDGRTTVSGLLPGTYRVTAYPEGANWAADPGLFERLAAGDEVQLDAKQTAVITVKAR